MTATHELRLKIDASAAEAGAKRFTGAIESVKRAVGELDRSADGTFAKLARHHPKFDVTPLRAATTEATRLSTALTGAGSASERAAAAIQRTALASASAVRMAEQATQRLALRMGDLGDTQGVASLNSALAQMKAQLVSATSTLDVRRAKSQFDDLRSGLLQASVAAEYARGAQAQLARELEQTGRAAQQQSEILSRLRAAHDPLFANSQRYSVALTEIQQLVTAGAVSESQAAAMRERAAQSYLAVGNSADTAATGMKRANAATMQGVMAGHQLSDILIVSQMGFQSVGMIALQQGSQLAAQMQTIKSSGGNVFKTILSGVTSLINPLSLATIGFVAVTAAVAKWAFSSDDAEKKSKKFADRISELTTTLNTYRDSTTIVNGGTLTLREEFGRAAESAQRFSHALAQVAALKLETQMRDGVAALATSLGGITALMEQWDGATFLPDVLRAETLYLTRDAVSKLGAEYGLTLNQARGLVDAISEAKLAKGPKATSDALQKVVAQLLAARAAGATLPPELVKAVEEAAQLGLTADRLQAIIAPIPALIGSATGQTNGWASAMSGVRVQVDAIMSSLSAIGGGVISNASKRAESVALAGGATIRQAEVARLRAENERNLAAQTMAANARGGAAGWAGNQLVRMQRYQFEEALRLDDQLAAQRDLARKRETKSGGGGRVEALGDESRQLAKISKQLNDRIFAIERENVALGLLAEGQVRTKEGAEAMAIAMALNGGSMDASTAATIRAYEASVLLNQQLERDAKDPYREYIDGLPSAVEAMKTLKAEAAKAVEEGLTDMFMGEFDPKKIVDGLRRQLAQMLAQRTMKMVFGDLLDTTGVKQASIAGANMMRTAIIAGSTQGAQMFAAAIATGAAGSAAGGGGKGGGGWLGAALALFGFAEGGYSDRPGMTQHVVSPAAFRNAPHYKAGTPNTSGIPAVLHDNEAVVPLSRGRKIPVEMSGADAETPKAGDVLQTINITTNVNVEGGDTSAETATRTAAAVRDTIKMAIRQELAESARYGGMMNPRGSR